MRKQISVQSESKSGILPILTTFQDVKFNASNSRTSHGMHKPDFSSPPESR